MRAFLFSGLAALSFGAQAQNPGNGPWNLEQCIEHGLRHNLSIQQAELNLENSKISYDQAKMNNLPSVNAGAGQFYQFGRSIDRFSNQFVNQTIRNNNFSLQANWTVFSGLQAQNSMAQNKFAFLASQKDLEITRNNISLQIANLYLQALLAKETLRNARLANDNTAKQLERTQKLFDAGATNEGVLLGLKAQLAAEEMNVVNAQNQVNQTLTALRLLLQLPESDGFDISDPEIGAFSGESAAAADARNIYETALRNMPEIQSAEMRLESARYGLRRTQGAYSPSLSVSGSMSTVYSQNAKEITGVNFTGVQPTGITKTSLDTVFAPTFSYDTRIIPFSKQFSNNFGQSVGVNLSIPIFNQFQVRNATAGARINNRLQEIRLEQARNQLLTDVTTAVNNFKSAAARMSSAEKNFNAQSLSLEFNQKRFEAGALNITDLTTSKNNESSARATLTQARYEYLFRMLVIEFYKGNPIKL